MSIINWPDPKNDLTVIDHQQIKVEFARRLNGRVKEAFIFGSFASDRFTHESDIDLVIVKETKETFTRRSREFVDLFNVFSRLDILVYTRGELERLLKKADGFFQGATLEKLF